MLYVVQIKKEKKTKKIHTGVTIPYVWLEDMGLKGDKYGRTCEMTYDSKTKEIKIKKACL